MITLLFVGISIVLAMQVLDALSDILHKLERLICVAWAIYHRLEPAEPDPTATRIDLYVKNGDQLERAIHVQQKATEAKTYVATPRDAKGNATAVQDAQWAVSDPTLASIVAAADGLSAVVTPVGPVGAFKIQLAADADLGAGVVPIAGEGDVEVIPGDAVTLEIAQA